MPPSVELATSSSSAAASAQRAARSGTALSVMRRAYWVRASKEWVSASRHHGHLSPPPTLGPETTPVRPLSASTPCPGMARSADASGTGWHPDPLAASGSTVDGGDRWPHRERRDRARRPDRRSGCREGKCRDPALAHAEATRRKGAFAARGWPTSRPQTRKGAGRWPTPSELDASSRASAGSAAARARGC